MNGIPRQMPPNGGGMPNGMPGGQGMPNGHMNFPMSNQPGHPQSGPGNTPGGPQQPLNIQSMMPGQRTMGQPSFISERVSFSRSTQGGVPQSQQAGQGMVQMPGNQHMGPMNRTMLPPNAPPSMANHGPGNQQQAHSPNYPQPLGRPSSRPSTPGQGVITNPSPSMSHRLSPVVGGMNMNEITAELMRIPNTLLPKLKQDAMIPLEKELTSMSPEEKVFFFPLLLVDFLMILSSTEFSPYIVPSIVPCPNKYRVLPNNRQILLALLRHPSWHLRTFVTTPRLSNEESGIARLPAKRKALPILPREHALLRVAVITQTHLAHPKTNLRWRLWLPLTLNKAVALLDHRIWGMV